uniref:type I toxin-antitoxin system Fst family toxin n=1 Tax=Staphylococcus epidermidis TaxID=1282 RepID=UPI0031585A57
MNKLYKSTTYNELLCQLNNKGQTPSFQRLSLFVIIPLYTTFIHPFNDAFSYFFIYDHFVSLFKISNPIKIRFCYTIEVVLLPAIDSTEGGVMMYLIFVFIIAPIIVECSVTLFKYWLEQRNKK